eukprot:427516_1
MLLKTHTNWLFIITYVLLLTTTFAQFNFFKRFFPSTEQPPETPIKEQHDIVSPSHNIITIVDEILNNEYKIIPEDELKLIYDYVNTKQYLINNDIEFDLPPNFNDKLKERFAHIFNTLDKYGYLEYSGVWTSLENAKTLITVYKNYARASTKIKSVLEEIRPFDIKYMLELYNETRITEQLLSDQDIVLFLGAAGAGKSTSIHFMCGSKFVETSHTGHFTPIVSNSNCGKVKITERITKADTKFITAVPINLEEAGIEVYDGKSNVMLCDTPGFFEESAELDVANGLGVVNAVKKAKSMRIFVTIDWSVGSGGRMKNFKQLAYTLANIVPNFKRYRKSIDFILTRVPETQSNKKSIKAKVALALAQNDNEFDSAFIDLLKLVHRSKPIILHPMKSDRTEVMEALFDESLFDDNPPIKQWIPYPSQVVKTFVTDQSMSKIKEQIQMHKEVIMRSVNDYKNQKRMATGICVGIDFEVLDIKLNELQALQQCLPAVKSIEETLNQCIDIIRNAFDHRIGAAITNIKNEYHGVHEFEQVVLNYKIMMGDVDHISYLQNKYFQNNIGISPQLLNETLQNEFESSLNNCTLSFVSAMYFDKAAIFSKYFPQFNISYLNRMEQIQNELDKLNKDTLEQIQKNNATAAYNNLQLLKNANHLNNYGYDIVKLLNNMEHELITNLNYLVESLKMDFELKTADVEFIINRTEEMNRTKEILNILQSYNQQFSIGSKISVKVRNIFNSATDLITNYCNYLSQFIENKLVTELTEQTNEQTEKNMTLVKLAMEEFHEIYQMNKNIQTEKCIKIYYKTTNTIIAYLDKVELHYSDIILKIIENEDDVTKYDYGLLNNLTRILKNCDWIYNLSGKPKDTDLAETISKQLERRMSRLSEQSKLIVPSVDDPGSLESVKNILDKLSKIRKLEEFLPKLSAMSNGVINVIQNDVRKVLNGIIRDLSLEPREYNNIKLTNTLNQVNRLIKEKESIEFVLDQPITQLQLESQHQLESMNAQQLLKDEGEYDVDSEQFKTAISKIKRQIEIYTRFQHIANFLNSEGLIIEFGAVDITVIKNILLNEVSNVRNRIEKPKSLKYKKLSKYLVFIDKCSGIDSWMSQVESGVDYEEMIQIIRSSRKTVETYLEEYSKSQDEKLRGCLNVLLDVNQQVTDDYLRKNGSMINQILIEYKRINRREEQYANIITHLYDENDISDEWKTEISSNLYTRLKNKLQELSKGKHQKAKLYIAVQRARILSDNIDWFLESVWKIKHTFSDLYLQYAAGLDSSIQPISEAIYNHNFLEASMKLRDLSEMPDSSSKHLYADVQIILGRAILKIYEDLKSQVMQLNNENDNVEAILKQFKLTKDSDVCYNYLTDSAQKKVTRIFEQAQSVLVKYIKSVSSDANEFVEIYKFTIAEQYIKRCKNIVNRHLSEMFGSKIEDMMKKCQDSGKSLSKKLKQIETKYTNIEFDDNAIESRINFYAINSIQYIHKALIDAVSTNAKYEKLWKDIESDIKIKFINLLKKSQNKSYMIAAKILTLCEDILNSLPKSTTDALKTQYEYELNDLQNSNKLQKEQLRNYLQQNDGTSVYILYKEMKNARNTKMIKLIESSLSNKATEIQLHLDQAIKTHNSVDIKHNLNLLKLYDESFTVSHYTKMGTEYKIARATVETFIAKKIRSFQNLIKGIKYEYINEIEQNLDFLLSLFNSNEIQKDKQILHKEVEKYSIHLSNFINEYFNKQNETFSAALDDLETTQMNSLLNSIKLFNSTQSDIITKLESIFTQSDIEQAKIQKHINYSAMITCTSTKFSNVKKEILNNGLVNKKIHRGIKADHYNYFLSLKSQLTSLKHCDVLKSHIDEQKLHDYYESCLVGLKSDLNDITKKIKKKLNRADQLTEDSYDYINDHYRILLALHEANVFSVANEDYTIQSKLKNEIDECSDLIHGKLLSLEQKLTQSINVKGINGTIKVEYHKIIHTLIEMEIFNTILVDFKGTGEVRINNCLKQFKEQHPKELKRLYSDLSQHESTWAHIIINEYPIFKALANFDFNILTAPYGIDHVLKHIDGVGDDIKEQSKKEEGLKKMFKDFHKQYQELVTKYHVRPEKINLKPLIAHIKKIPKNLKQTKNLITWDLHTKNQAIELLSHVFALWTCQNSASFWDLVDEMDARSYRVQPRDAQVISIFRLLGIGNKAESYTNKVWDGLKELASTFTFGWVSPETETLMPNLVEIGTGEGKSLTLAMASSVLALLGFNVNVACYSEYLTRRDEKSFEQLFISLGIRDNIVYGTFNELCENIINEKGNIRHMVSELILPGSSQNMSTKPSSVSDKDRANVLLIDEVDVFFNKEFYGEYYTAGAVLKHKCIKGITDYIWKHKLTLRFKAIKSINEYKQCIQVFSNEWTDIIDEQIKCMLSDANTFNTPPYIVKRDRIGYKEGDQVSYTAIKGYKTLFAYYYEHYENKVISDKSLNDAIAFYLNCGTFSYAEIPKKFNLIMGVTGTLKNLSRPQLDTMDQNYALKVHTWMPSLFGEKKFRFDPLNDIKITSITDFNEDLKEEIRMRLRDHASPRCVFVFFENALKLNSFYDSKPFKIFHGKTRILTEKLDFDEKEKEVKRAPWSDKITLLTKSFGRGTDFKVMDDLVRNNGGPHVIQTFVSLELSEETQIKGRTARQGGEGSYSMVLIEHELERFHISKEEIETAKSNGNLYQMINEKRNAEFAKEYAQTADRIKTAKEVHVKGEEFLNSLHANDIQKIQKDLLSYNLGPASETYKIALLVDGTGSMTSTLSKTKERISEMYKRIREILTDPEFNYDPNLFEIQIAVYRNYNAPPSKLLQMSGWQNNPIELDNFLKDVEPEYGMGNEAIEVGLQFLNNDEHVDEAIMIGDWPPNTKDQVDTRRKNGKWENTMFAIPAYFDDELEKLNKKGLKINTFYLTNMIKQSFQKIADATGGKCLELNIENSEGAEQLTGLISKTVLEVCGGTNNGQKLRDAYDSKYTHIS